MRILVATDGSDASDRAVDLAARLTKELAGHLKIIHIITLRDWSLTQIHEYALWEHVTAGEVLNAFSEETLRTARQRAEVLGVTDVQSESCSESQVSEIAELIIDAARRDNVDMIILGKRGRGRVSGLLLGSVSQQVVSVATCPVVVVP
jgi:Universal stress protein UspA and related nucleotide-binding proteins